MQDGRHRKTRPQDQEQEIARAASYWLRGLRLGLIMIGVAVLLLGLGFLIAPDSNLLGGFGPLAWLVGAIGQIAVLISCGVGLAEWTARRWRRRRRAP